MLRDEIAELLLKQLRMMLDCFFRKGAEFELINNGEFASDFMTEIPAHICEEYGLRLVVASLNHEGQFDIDGECIGTLGECVTRRGVSTRFGVGVHSPEVECSLSVDDTDAFHSISLRIPSHVSSADLTVMRDELREIVMVQTLRHPCCCCL